MEAQEKMLDMLNKADRLLDLMNDMMDDPAVGWLLDLEKQKAFGDMVSALETGIQVLGK